MTNINWRTYLLIWAFSFASITAAAGFFNYRADPFWVSQTAAPWAQFLSLQDERQIKTNKLWLGDEPYDAVLMGSSRAARMETQNLEGKVFNYAFSSAYPNEYLAFLDFFAARKGVPETIYLNVDFFGTRQFRSRRFLSPDHYVQTSSASRYRLKTIFGIDTLLSSIKNAAFYSSGPRTGIALYTRDAVAHQVRAVDERGVTAAQISKDLNWFRRSRFSPEVYRYNSQLADTFVEIKSHFPDTKIVVFTSPVSLPMYRMLMEEGRFEDYARWIRELVMAFGSVRDFMGESDFASDKILFFDFQHVTEEGMAIIASAVSGTPPKGYEDFGAVITEASVDAYLEERKRQSVELLKRPAPATVW